MRRILVLTLIAGFLVAALLSRPGQSTGQDNSPERIAALETQVSNLTGDVSSLRKRVKKLEQASQAKASEVRTPQSFEGTGNLSTHSTFGAGDYKVSAECSTGVIFVYVTDEATNDVQIPISKDLVNDDGAKKLIVPKNANLLIEVMCDGDWSVSFE